MTFNPSRSIKFFIAVIATAVLALRPFMPVAEAQSAEPEILTIARDVLSIEEKKKKDVRQHNELVYASVLGNALMNTNEPITEKPAKPAVMGASYERALAIRSAGVSAGTEFFVEVTAYSSTPDQCDSSPFITASGTHVHPGTLAANFLPFGTKVIFPDYSGDRVYVVEDRMNKRFSSRADIWLETRAAAYAFGKRHLRMVVVE